MTNNANTIDNATSYSSNDGVLVGNGKSLPITHTGSISALNSFNSLSLRDILVVPELTKNLISISSLMLDLNCRVIFVAFDFTIQDLQTRAVLGTGRHRNGLYVLDRGQPDFLTLLRQHPTRASFEIWHARLGHSSPKTVVLFNKNVVICTVGSFNSNVCSSCQLTKSHRLPFLNYNARSLYPFDIIHYDLWGPSLVATLSGFHFYVIFINDHNRFTWFYPLCHKSDFFDVFIRFQKLVKNQFSRTIKVFQADGRTEFINLKFKHHLAQCGIQQRLACPYTPNQNGTAEHKHRAYSSFSLSSSIKLMGGSFCHDRLCHQSDPNTNSSQYLSF